MQKWEYYTLVRERAWEPVKGMNYAKAGKWNVGIDDTLAELGDQGWELVSVASRSSYLGAPTGAAAGTASPDYAGFTSSEIWVFKRPKQD
jgi:hypothetical protein